MTVLSLPSPATRLTWRTPEQKDLISVEAAKISVHLYDATPDDLRSLSIAIEAVLKHIASLNSLHYNDPKSQ